MNCGFAWFLLRMHNKHLKVIVHLERILPSTMLVWSSNGIAQETNNCLEAREIWLQIKSQPLSGIRFQSYYQFNSPNQKIN